MQILGHGQIALTLGAENHVVPELAHERGAHRVCRGASPIHRTLTHRLKGHLSRTVTRRQ